VAADPGRLEDWRSLGIALGKLGRFEDAFACFDRSEGRASAVRAREAPCRWPAELFSAFHDHMAGMPGGAPVLTHVAADIQFTFKAAVAVLCCLLSDYDMDGVVVAVARPPQAYRQALARRVATAHPPAYVEVAGPAVGGVAGPAADGDASPVPACEPDRIAASVRSALAKTAEQYGGEEHFVLMDDLASMEFYAGTETVRRFSAGLFGELSGFGILPFVVLPDEKANLLGLAPLAPRRRLRVEGAWLAGA
jgi:hypothetical protein